ncbi:hypothetical protein [Serratia odorifera]|uniref:Uncharacterized protein n=1 Tax=Serratia odorifera TaxID=618 RepID=A0A3S4FV54_SEROD|nr:hypothetical protein [Serratia odorifera]VDZ64186.1 Uncharacterised protein [Serratia odorifera]
MKINEALPTTGKASDVTYPWFSQEFIQGMLPTVLDVVSGIVRDGGSEEKAIEAAKIVTKATLIAFLSITAPSPRVRPISEDHHQ